ADLRLERVQGPAGGADPRAAYGQGPCGVRGGAPEPGPVQPEDDRGDRPPPGGRQGEVRRGGAVRLPAQPGRGGPLPPRLGTERRGTGAVAGPGGRLRVEDQLAP